MKLIDQNFCSLVNFLKNITVLFANILEAVQEMHIFYQMKIKYNA